MILNDAVQHLILFCVLFFLVGFALGRSINNTTIINEQSESFFKTNKKNNVKKNKPIVINDKTHVTKIQTDNLEKKYDNIGNTQTTNENISQSVNKLKNLKK